MIRDQIGYGLRILFIGINPHPGSDRRGVPFSNNKMFWYLLQAAGLLIESRDQLRDDRILKRLYLHDFKKVYRFGAFNIIKRPTRAATQLQRAEAAPGRIRLHQVISRYQPAVVCFVGKTPYRFFIECNQVEYGWQPSIESSRIYVMHTPLHGPAQVRIQELKEIRDLLERM
jgi:double-stranded uracil-DNA glycosylase